MKKLKAKFGESIAETLVAVLVLALAFLMMVGAVTASARVNSRVKNVGEDDDDSVPQAKGKATVSVSLDGIDTLTVTATPQLYEVNGNYYYE